MAIDTFCQIDTGLSNQCVTPVSIGQLLFLLIEHLGMSEVMCYNLVTVAVSRRLSVQRELTFKGVMTCEIKFALIF